MTLRIGAIAVEFDTNEDGTEAMDELRERFGVPRPPLAELDGETTFCLTWDSPPIELYHRLGELLVAKPDAIVNISVNCED